MKNRELLDNIDIVPEDEVYDVAEKLDEKQLALMESEGQGIIISQMSKALIDTFVYEFDVKGESHYGLSVTGVNQAWNWIADHDMASFKIQSSDLQFVEPLRKWAATVVAGLYLKNGQTHMSTASKDCEISNPHGAAIAMSKAITKIKRDLLPAEVKHRLTRIYQAQQSETELAEIREQIAVRIQRKPEIVTYLQEVYGVTVEDITIDQWKQLQKDIAIGRVETFTKQRR